MTPADALIRLKRGESLDCVTPKGIPFQIQVKLAAGLAWYRTRPARKGCLNRYSRLSDSDVLDWLGRVTIQDH
jgi:hypothetical protein